MDKVTFGEWRELSQEEYEHLYRPIYGPFCSSPCDHTWTMTIQEGRVCLDSGCEDCNDGVMSSMGGEDVEVPTKIQGKLKAHVEKYGWETIEYDCWWEFIPTKIEGKEEK
jgi:hypothetical protein